MAHVFKEGDKVIIGWHPDNHTWVNPMNKFIGKTTTIIRVSNGGLGYFLKIDNNMFEGFYYDEKSLTLVGCPCRIKNCLKHQSK